MSRTGKIARLPKAIREQLNGRLQDGELGTDLVLWLNELPECQKLLAEKFGGRPISEQNLSEWKQGGYEEWARQEASRERVQALMEQADDLDGVAGGREISDRLGSLVAAELAEAIRKLEDIWANWLYRVQNGLPLPEELRGEQIFMDLSHFNPGKFDPIKPNQSKSNQKEENGEQSENRSG